VFWNGDLNNYTVKALPTKLNRRLVQTNGGILTSDGLVAIKQWSIIPEDIGLFAFAIPPLFAFLTAIVILSMYVVFRKLNRWGTFVQIVGTAVIGPIVGLALVSVIGMMILKKMRGDFDPIVFLTTNTIFHNKGGGGELKLIDPITLEVAAELVLEERCSFARMALTTLPNGEDAFALLGDEFVHQVRWNPQQKRLYSVPNWSTRYRTRWTGSFPGTGPAIFNNTAFFTDNTFPVFLFGRSYSLFSIDMLTPADRAGTSAAEPCIGNCPPPAFKSVSLATGSQPGFMFWSVAISPVVGDVIVWDSAGKSVQSRRMSDLSLHWNISAWNLDCITLAADRGHVYLSDYSDAPPNWYRWLYDITKVPKTSYGQASKSFIIADAESGTVISNMTLSQGGGFKPSPIIPGGHNDVIFPSPTGLMRIYV
jgi:phosphate/sulfate permease